MCTPNHALSMRKRFVLLLRVVVENYASGLINEGIADTVAWCLSAPQVAFYMEYVVRNVSVKVGLCVVWRDSPCMLIA